MAHLHVVFDGETVFLKRGWNGGYNGVHQRASFKGEWFDVEIPAWKTFLFTYGKDKNFLYGESAFKSAWYHYNVKHKLYHLANLAQQTSAVPPKVLSGPVEVNPAERNRAMKMVEKLGGVRTTAYVPDQFTLTPYDSSKGASNPLPLIEHHNAEMARSVLAQFLMLGSSGSKVGSFALSKDHSDLLMVALKGVMGTIEDHINYYLIPDLIDLNFANPLYPEWHFEDMTDDTQAIVLAAFTQMVTNGTVTDEMKEGIEDLVAEALDIDRDEITKRLEKEAAKKAAAAKKAGMAVDAYGNPLPARQTVEVPPGGTVPSGGDKAAKPGDAAPAPAPTNAAAPGKPVNQSDSEAGGDPKGVNPRELTKAEKRVDFPGLERKLDQMEQELESKLATCFDTIKDDALKRLRVLLEQRDVKGVGSFTFNYTSAYRELIARQMKAAYDAGKMSAADELKIPAPTTNRDAVTFINQTATTVVDKQMSDLLFTVKNIVLSHLRRNQLADSVDLGLFDILGAISAAFTSYFSSHAKLTAPVAVAQAFNRGRSDGYASGGDMIYAYQWSAVMDKRTCVTCQDLDGSVFSRNDTSWEPPVHVSCRCIKVAILSDESNPPAITGLPKSPGGMTSPSL